MIAVENVTVTYGDRVVLKNISLNLGPGLTLILGRNGSGKSTLLKTMAGLLRPLSGRVLVFGRDVHRLPRREVVRLVGYVWQNPYAGFVEVTVKDELEFTSRVAGLPLNSEIVETLVPRHLAERNPFTLSGGEAKRVSMASVLALDQPVWLVDEPFDYLDSEGVKAFVKLVEYGLSKGKIVVVATANVAYLHMLKANKAVVLFNGEKVFEGDPGLVDNEVLCRYGIPSKAMICG